MGGGMRYEATNTDKGALLRLRLAIRRQRLSMSARQPGHGVRLCLPALLAACLLVPCYAQAAGREPWPLPSGRRSYVERDFLQDRQKWYRALTVDAYAKIGLKNAAWDAAVGTLLEAFSKSQGDGSIDADDFLAAGEPAVKMGCNDPLVLHIVAEAMWERGRAPEAEPLAAKAIEGFKQVPYSKAIAWDAPVVLMETAHFLGKEDDAATGKELSLKWLAEAAAEPAIKAGNLRPLWRWVAFRVMTDGNYGLLDEVHKALLAQPNADPWLVNMIGGRTFVKEGWKARGSGFANTVTDAGEKTFQDNLRKARDCYTRAWELHREYPEAAAAMIEIAMASNEAGPDDLRLWFDRSVTAQFDHPGAYSRYEWALRPRWRGSVEEMAAFGEECLNTGRFDTAVPRQYLDLATAIAEEEDTPKFWQAPGVYANLKRLFEGYIAEPSQSAASVMQWKSQYVAFAWRTGHLDDAARLLRELGPKLDETTFASFNVRVAVIRGQVLAAAGEQAARVKQAETLYAAGSTDKAIEAFAALAEQLKDASVQAYLSDRLTSLRMEQALAKGEWVKLAPTAALDGWTRLYGDWQVGADGSATTTNPEANLLACNMRTDGNLEITGTIELPGDGKTANAGVVVGLDKTGTPYWSTLQLVGKAGQLQWCRNFKRSAGADFTPTRTFTVTLRLWQGRVAAYVNGQRCFPDEELYSGLADAPGVLLGFGAADYEGEAGVKYTNFQVRRLTEKPSNPPTLGPAAPAETATAPAPAGQNYLFYEAEKTLQARGWNTSNYWAPSGGLFLYRLPGGSNATAHFDLRSKGPWAVWLRVRDETDGERQVVAKVNGVPSYVMGGTNAGDWRWCQLSVVNSDKIDLEVIPITPSPMDAWIDAILLTDDPGFIPPPKPPLPDGYTTYQPATDPTKAERAGWVWWPATCAHDSSGFYRKTFDLAAVPTRATLELAASGAATVWINMHRAAVGTSVDGQDVKALLVQGKNQVAVQMVNTSALPGLKLRLVVDLPSGAHVIVRSDPTWKSSGNIPPLWGAVDFDDSAWSRVFARITDRD